MTLKANHWPCTKKSVVVAAWHTSKLLSETSRPWNWIILIAPFLSQSGAIAYAPPKNSNNYCLAQSFDNQKSLVLCEGDKHGRITYAGEENEALDDSPFRN
jgi:hypothetical protein